MRGVERPAIGAAEAFSDCISRFKEDFKAGLEVYKDTVINESADYEPRARAAELHLLQPVSVDDGRAFTAAMIKVYEQGMVRGGGRHIYEQIKALPKHGICPFCDHHFVMTLDHLLPKSLFPALAVTPDNLVGACSDCNRLKLDCAPTLAQDTFIHPYFDNVEGGQWLGAQLVQGPVAALKFETRVVAQWPDALNKRVHRQFEVLKLARLYGAQAARTISDQVRLLSALHRDGGSNSVRLELRKQAETREANSLNSWQAVTYRTLSDCDWFCDTGFGCV